MAQDHLERASHLNGLAIDLDKKYDQMGNLDDLRQAILNGKEAVAAIPSDHSDRPDFLRSLYIRLNKKYRRTGDLNDLEQAILYTQEVVEATQETRHLSNLAVFLSKRYDRTRDLDDLEQAIFYAEVSVATTPHDDLGNRASNCSMLAIFLSRKYPRTEDLADIQQAVLYAREAVEATSKDSPSILASRLSNLGSFLSKKYERELDLDDLQQSISYMDEAMVLIPPDHPERFGFLTNMICSLNLRYDRTQEPEDLQRAIWYAKGALESMPQNHPHRVLQLSALSNSLYREFDRTGDLENLLQAISYRKEQVAETPQDDPYRFQRLVDLAHLLEKQYNRTGDIEDLHQAVLCAEGAMEIRSQGYLHAVQAGSLSILASLLCQKYERTSALGDLQKAISYSEEVIALTPENHPDRADYLANLSTAMGRKYQRTGDMDSLQQSILYAEEAVATDPRGHPRFDRAYHLSQLVLPLGIKYDRTGDLDDLRRSILYAKEGIAATPRYHPERPGRLTNLANALHMKYTRTGDLGDLQQTIAYAEEAVELTPQNSPWQVGYNLNLANAQSMMYQHMGDPADLLKAIARIEGAMKKMSQDNPERSSYLANMATYLQMKHCRLEDKDDSDIEKAIGYAEEAVSIIPEDHPNRAGLLSNLAAMLDSRTDNANDRNKVFLIFRKAWECHNSPPLIRINAARNAAEYLNSVEEWEESSRLLEDSIGMLPKVSPRSLEGKDKQHILLGLNGLATQAASTALQAGKSAYHALKLLELSRGIIMGSTIDCRGDISDLREKYPEPFKKFNDLRIEIDTPLPDRPNDSTINTKSLPFHTEEAFLQARSQALRRREKAIHEMEKTLEDIRKLPDYEGFQLPPSEKDLKSWAKDGPVVTFISSPGRSDAIIVTSSTITALPLPNLKLDEIPNRLEVIFEKPPKSTKKAKKSPAAAMREYAERNTKMREMLLWLWNVAVEPVLQELELIGDHGGVKNTKLAHIWWIGVGRLSVAPFHAAGDHSRGSTRNTLSCATSSYTPTIKALSYAREKELNILSEPESRLLLVTMSKTPGGLGLPDVEQEVGGILDVTKGLISAKHLAQPSANDVLKQFGSFHAMHFACHGVSDGQDPSNSHLMLQKNSEAADQLTVHDISRKSTKVAQIAYLSACSTAFNPAALLADETIHIASGFQLAGFNHVLATMWPAESDVCKEIAVDFYRFLFDGKDGGEGHLKVGMAFHDAVVKAREKNPLLPRKWAPFIHMGA